MKMLIKQSNVVYRNKAHGMARATGALRTRVIRDKTKYTRKQKHKGQ